MYDKTQEPNEFTGESAADATQQAARFFGLEEATSGNPGPQALRAYQAYGGNPCIKIPPRMF